MTHFRTKPYIFKRYQRILRYHLRPQRMLKKRLHRKCRQINTESTRSLLHRQCVYHNGWVLVHDVDWFLMSSSRTNKTGDELHRGRSRRTTKIVEEISQERENHYEIKSMVKSSWPLCWSGYAIRHALYGQAKKRGGVGGRQALVRYWHSHPLLRVLGVKKICESYLD